MPDYRVLIVAPETNLAMAEDEVMQVVNLLGAKILKGEQAKTIHGLLNVMAEPFDIVWFATHGDETGIYLEDGVVTTSELTTLVKSVGARLVVLNTCSSRSVALGIHDELRISLICTIRKIPDRTAFITGVIFARKLAAGLSFREAYEDAKPGQNNTYLFLPEERIEQWEIPEMPPLERPGRVDADLQSLASLVKRLEIIVTGNPDYNVTGLVPTVRQLNEKMEKLLYDFEIMRANQIFNRRLLVGTTFLSIMLMIAVLALSYQRFGS